MKKRLGWWWVCGIAAASAALGADQPLFLDGGTIDTTSDAQQAMVRLLKSSPRPPTVQRATSRGTMPWFVQFAGTPCEKWQSALEAEGAKILGYVPENAFLLEATPETLVRIASMDHVTWAGEYLPLYKKSRALASLPEDGGECVVTLFDPADKRRVAREFGEMNAFVPRTQLEADGSELRARLTAAQIDEVAQWGEVEWIEPSVPLQSWGGSAPEPADVADVVAEWRRAYAAGEKVGTLLRGAADAGAYGADSRAIDRFVWEHPEMLVVAAAGNAATDLDPADGVADAGSVASPATAKNVLSVGAAEGRRDVARVWRDSWPEDFSVEPIALDRMAQTDGPQGLAAFSGRGPCADGRFKPDLVAPGTYVVVPRPADSDFTGWGAAENTNEIYVGGTGVAAEQVAEAAQQARQWLADERGLAAPSAALVKALLLAGARDLAPGQYGTGTKQEIPFGRPNSAQGAGWLDPAGALRPDENGFLDVHEAPGLATGAADAYELAVDRPGDRFTLALVYSDPAAAPCAGKQLVNDLDLTVSTPAGAVLHANGRASPDDVNNVEMIEFEADEAGTYLARVQARAVPMGGSQPYALVVRGPRTEAATAAASEQP